MAYMPKQQPREKFYFRKGFRKIFVTLYYLLALIIDVGTCTGWQSISNPF